MRSTKRLLLCVGAVLLNACSLLQQPGSTSPAASEAAVGETDAGFTPMPNPYNRSQKTLPNHVLARFMEAQLAMEAEQWSQAQALLEQLVGEYPTLSGPYVNLGLVYRQQGDLDRAEEMFRQAIAVNRLNGEAYNQLAVLHRERGEFEEAEQRYLEALDVWPHNAVVHRNLGILYDLYMGRFDQALQHYRMTQKLLPEPERQLEGWIVDLERRIAE